MKKISIILVLAAITCFSVSAQILKPAKWTFTSSKPTAKVGETVELYFTAAIDNNWYMYSSELKVDGPLPTTVKFTPNASYVLVGKFQPAITPKKHQDEIWGGEVAYFEKIAKFKQKVKILKANPAIEGKIECQTCTTTDGKCVPNKDKFKFDIKTL